VILRRERPGDEAAIAAVHVAAFARPDDRGATPPEVTLVDDLRASDAWIPALSIVAIVDGVIVGHVVCSRATLDGRDSVLGLGPLGVRPEAQNAGVGTALVHAVVAAADALDEPLVALLGNPAYYRRFGFEPATEHGIEPPDPGYGVHFQVRLLIRATGTEHGPFRYAPAFDGVP
jgi:putative acetyltransferase